MAIILLVLIFAGLYFYNQWKPREYSWEPTYSRHDKEPFGAYVFDRILKASWPEKYTHSYKGIPQLLGEKLLTDQNLLIVTSDFSIYEEEMEKLFQYIAEGHQVLIASEYFDPLLRDSLQFNSDYSFSSWLYFQNKDIRNYSLSFHFTDSALQHIEHPFPSVNVRGYFSEIKDSAWIVIAENDSLQPVLMRYPMGKGNLIVSATPRIFTNYGILDPQNKEFTLTVLAYLKDAPLLRTEFYGAGSDESSSIFRYMESKPPLRWALYLTFAACLLFMIFTAKRKQKPIPVIKEPENRALQFVRSVAELYLRKNSNSDIVLKKYNYWADAIKKEYGLDVINSRHNDSFFETFASKTGMPVEDARKLFGLLDAIDTDTRVKDDELIRIVQLLKIK